LHWFERLSSLYNDGMPPPNDISRTLRWASTAMIGMLNEKEHVSSQSPLP
jgi:hypothetical protein